MSNVTHGLIEFGASLLLLGFALFCLHMTTDMLLQVTGRCIGLVSTNECYISLVTSSCESTTMSCGLNKVDIETQGSTKPTGPLVPPLLCSYAITQGLSGY